MWRPGAPWEAVSHAVKVIQFAPTNVDRATDSDLQQAVSDIKRRKLELAVGTGPLIRSNRCQSKSEDYVDQGADRLPAIREYWMPQHVRSGPS